MKRLKRLLPAKKRQKQNRPQIQAIKNDGPTFWFCWQIANDRIIFQ